METTNIHQAKTHLSQLIERALAGEEIIIARAGKPVVKLVPYQEALPLRKGGQWKGQIWMSDDFDAPDPELEALFYDGPVFPDQP